MSETLRVCEIYRSIQGESTRVGLPCVLVRLAGCNLNCSWCDTPHAKTGASEEMTIDEVLARVAAFNCPRVELTGGEPLLQPAAITLLERLCQAGYETLLETNGSQDISTVDPQIRRIVDIKCPASNFAEANLWSNIDHLTRRDEVKFVIAGRADYEYARRVVGEYKLTHRCEVIFSPAAGSVTGAELAKWILADNLDVRLGMQLHKILWPNKEKGV
jgi:7-carboxy-7-deazaguanine synthase